MDYTLTVSLFRRLQRRNPNVNPIALLSANLSAESV